MAELLDDVLEATEVPEEVSQPQVDDVPEKYRGKSPKEIIAMHQEAEKLIGKQGSEVGELRKVVDDFIKTQTFKDSKAVETQVNDEDFFVDPSLAVNRAIDNHPTVKEAKQASMHMKEAEVRSKLAQNYPNYQEVVNDPNFIDWIKSSNVRTQLFLNAENNLDYDSAAELFGTWQEKQSFIKQATDTAALDRKKQLNAADVGSTGSTESVSKKKYRRSDIIKLIKTDPKRYEALAPEIERAYREGRVI